MNNQTDIIRRFNEFKQSFNGNPRDKVMEMLNNGQITQADLNKVQVMANQLKGILNI